MGQGRFPLYIGARKSEPLGLRREHVHGDGAVLPDSKSGPRTIWLPTPARANLGTPPPWLRLSIDVRSRQAGLALRAVADDPREDEARKPTPS